MNRPRVSDLFPRVDPIASRDKEELPGKPQVDSPGAVHTGRWPPCRRGRHRRCCSGKSPRRRRQEFQTQRRSVRLGGCPWGQEPRRARGSRRPHWSSFSRASTWGRASCCRPQSCFGLDNATLDVRTRTTELLEEREGEIAVALAQALGAEPDRLLRIEIVHALDELAGDMARAAIERAAAEDPDEYVRAVAAAT